jgi:cytoskeleton protein RodZ
MSLEELGRTLRQERERRGLSVEEVANRLKLMPRVVRAIEQADIEVLPQAAYARGFVKAYGNLLELEAELLQAGIEDGWPGELHQSAVPYEPVEERRGGGKGRLTAFISLVLILAAASGFWFFRDLDLRLPSGEFLKAEPAISAKKEILPPQAQVKAAPLPESRNQALSRQASSPPGVGPAAAAVAPAASGQTGLQTVPTDSRRAATENIPDAGSQAPLSPVSSSAGPQDSPHQLIIIALAECWVHSNADDTDTRQFSLRQGDTFALTFNKKLVLKLGNAGGVRLRLDGRDLEPPGTIGQVKTLTFPSSP